MVHAEQVTNHAEWGVHMRVRFLFPGLIALAVAVPSGALAQGMSVATFLAKADALQARGMTAMFSSDIGLLKGEIGAASTAFRADAASRAPRSCPPPKGQAKMSSDDLITAFRAIPPAQRATMTVQRGFSDFMVKRYPCK